MKTSTWKIGATLFALLGIGLVVAATLLELKQYRVAGAICQNLGLATLAVLIVDLIWRLVGGNPVDVGIATLDQRIRELVATTRVIDQASRVGITDLYVRQGDFGTQDTWENLLRTARKNIDVMARTAFGWSKSHLLQEILAERVTQGVSVRWLMMSRDNQYLRLLEEEDSPSSSLLDGKLVAMERAITKARLSLSLALQDKLQLRSYSHVPLYCAFVRVDERWYVTQYLFSRSSDECPLICIRGEESNWGGVYADEFEFIWKSAREVPLSRTPASSN
jgi:hypothetical protein